MGERRYRGTDAMEGMVEEGTVQISGAHYSSSLVKLSFPKPPRETEFLARHLSLPWYLLKISCQPICLRTPPLLKLLSLYLTDIMGHTAGSDDNGDIVFTEV